MGLRIGTGGQYKKQSTIHNAAQRWSQSTGAVVGGHTGGGDKKSLTEVEGSGDKKHKSTQKESKFRHKPYMFAPKTETTGAQLDNDG